MLKLCKNHSKSFKVPFGGGTRKKERKKEKTEWFFFSLLRPLPPSLSPLLSFLYSCLFLPASIIIRYHSIPFHSVPPHHHHHLPPRSYFDSFPPFQPLSLSLSLSLSLTLCIFFYCFPLNYGNQLKLRGLLLKALEFDYYNHIYKGW